MPINGIPSGTGLGPLPDVGVLSYNDVPFSCLYTSQIDGQVVPDDAHRTTKLMEYTLSIEGIVTLPTGEPTTDQAWLNLRQTLSVTGATLIYSGKGFGNLAVNKPGGTQWDVAWGPVPKVLFFQPLGGSRSALIRWQVTFRLPELGNNNPTTAFPAGSSAPVLQFNYGITATYDERGYRGIALKGTLGIPMTRTAAEDRQVRQTVDAFRQRWLDVQADLQQYRPTHRSFDYSRDRRTLEWEFRCEEMPPMGLPPGCTLAMGTQSVRRLKRGAAAGALQVLPDTSIWAASLRCTYTVRKDEDRRNATLAFYSVLWWRMWHASYGTVGLNNNGNAAQQPPNPGGARLDNAPPQVPVNLVAGSPTARMWDQIYQSAHTTAPKPTQANAMLMDFSWDEGLYQASDSITFTASWWIVSTFSNIMLAAGTFRWMPGSAAGDGPGGTLWGQSVQDIMGWKSWLENSLDPGEDVIIDLGVAGPP